MVRAILFDLGDTLLNFRPMDNNAIVERGGAAVYKHMLEHGCGKLPPEPVFRRRNVRAVRRAIIWSWLRKREFNVLKVVSKQVIQCGAPDDDKFMLELGWLWYEPVVEYSSIEPNLIATLQALRDEGLKLGIVSNTFIPGAILDRHIEMMGFKEFFPVRLYSSEIGYRKPHPLIFQKALTAIGTRASETLFIGDVIKNDVIGAKRLGMKTALKLKGQNGNTQSPADYTVRNISDLVPILCSRSQSAARPCPQPSEDSDQLIQPA